MKGEILDVKRRVRGECRLTYAGEPSLFAGKLSVPSDIEKEGTQFFLRVTAFQPSMGNTGMDERGYAGMR